MKSKAHYKKCVELGLNPVPITLDDDAEMDGDQNSLAGGSSTIPGDDSDSYSDSDGDDGDSDSGLLYILSSSHRIRNIIS